MRPSMLQVWWVRATDALAFAALLSVLAAVVVAALRVLSGPTSGPAQQALVIRLALARGDVHAALVDAPPELFPGSGIANVALDGGPAAARAYLANALTESRLARGAAFTADLSDPRLAADLDALERAVIAPLIEAELVRALDPLGLFDGSRAADWAAELGDAPAMGVSVRPLLGVNVALPVEQVRGATPREIGERVVARLAVRLAEGGEGALLEAVEPAAWIPVIQAALDGPVAGAVRAALSASWRAREGEWAAYQEAVAARAAGRERLATAGLDDVARAAAAEPDPTAALAVALADLAYARGGGALAAAWPLPDGSDLPTLTPAVDLFAASTHEALTRPMVLLVALAIVLLAVLAAAQRGPAMLLVPAGVLAVAGLPSLALALVGAGLEVPPFPTGADGGIDALLSAARWWAASATDLALGDVTLVLLTPFALALALLLVALARAVLTPPKSRSRF